MSKKRGRCPSFVSATFGSPKIEIAKGKRTCKRNGNSIFSGERCVTVRVVGTQGRKSYSIDGIKEIIAQTRSDLDRLVQCLERG